MRFTMCGIAGFSGSFNPQFLDHAIRIQANRGPDDNGTFYSEQFKIGLAHTRLSIIDTSYAGHQPMSSKCGQYSIVYNGEIYNFKELKKELKGNKSIEFHGESDTEVLLQMYIHYGRKMLSKLNGIFAFAIWDQNKEEIFVARDHFGIKPLYYTQTCQGIAFASELKTLNALEKLDRSIDLTSVALHLTYLWCPHPNTMYESVKKLEPGQFLIIKNGNINLTQRFFNNPLAQLPAKKFETSKIINELDKHLEQAVSRQMVSDVPLGAFLSGGLDSSAISFYAKKHISKQSFDVFTIKLSGNLMKAEGFADDFPYAEKVAKHLDLNLNVLEITSDIFNNLDKMIYALDEPLADLAALNTFFISEYAREKGVKVLLSGTGGDDIFTGYRRHLALQAEKYWSWLPLPARKAVKHTTGQLSSQQSTQRRIKKAFQYSDLSENERLLSYFYWLDPKKARLLLNKDISESLLAPLLSKLDQVKNAPALNKMLFLEQNFFLTDHNLNYTDKMSMLTSVEVRVPFLDIDLVNFAAQIPVQLKQRGPEGKWILKKVMEGKLPHDVIYRPKTGFGIPLRYWMKEPKTNKLRPFFLEIFNSQKFKEREIFNHKEVLNLIKEDEQGKIDASYSIFSLICIEIWFQKFIDSK